MATWDQIRAGIFAGESGGDYDALFGYSNRPGGQFAGTRLTDMTVNQALDFANPRGPYASWVRDQVGHVATPMGAYQVVGSTLRDAVRGLGLRGDERMTPELQDRIGRWIYDTQGTGAWVGYQGPQDVTASTRGAAPMMGLLADNQAPAEPQSFMDRLRGSARSGELFDALAMGFNSMRMNPDPSIAALVERRAGRREDTRTRNRTAEFLRARGREDLAAAVESGALGGQAAVQLAYQQPEDNRTALQQNYEFLISQGLSPEEALGALRSGTVVNTGNQGPQVGTIPQGFQLIQDPTTGGYRMEPIPGGPAATEAATSEDQAGMRAESAARQADIVLDEIAAIRSKMTDGGLPTTGAIGGLLSNIGGTDAGDIRASIDTISGNIAFDRLQQMREASPTGGALGAVTERELALLSSVLGSLNQTQSAEQFERNLARLEEIYTDIMRKAQAYPNAAEFGFGGGGAAPAVTLSPGAQRYLGGN